MISFPARPDVRINYEKTKEKFPSAHPAICTGKLESSINWLRLMLSKEFECSMKELFFCVQSLSVSLIVSALKLITFMWWGSQFFCTLYKSCLPQQVRRLSCKSYTGPQLYFCQLYNGNAIDERRYTKHCLLTVTDPKKSVKVLTYPLPWKPVVLTSIALQWVFLVQRDMSPSHFASAHKAVEQLQVASSPSNGMWPPCNLLS